MGRQRFFLHCLLAGMLVSYTGCGPPAPTAQAIALPSESIEQVQHRALQDPIFVEVDEIPANWWTLFGDSQLSDLIEQALEDNPSLQIAEAKIRSAQYNAEAVRSYLFPTLFATGNLEPTRLSKTTIPPTQGFGNTLPPIPVGAPPFNFTEYQLALNILYDFDVWGKLRNNLKSAWGEYQARIADAAFVRLGISIAVAEAYFHLQIALHRQEIAEQLVANRSQLSALTQNRQQRNLDSALQTLQTQENLAGAIGDRTLVLSTIAQQTHQLNTYLGGDFSTQIDIRPVDTALLESVPLPKELPLHLLSNRPDITAQLWLIEAAGKQVEVAQAGFYPDFNLMGSAGFNTIFLQTFFQNRSTFGFIEPAVTLPLFTGGLLKANLDNSVVNLDRAIIEYNDLILRATKEVLDGIEVLQFTHAHLKQAHTETDSQKKMYQLRQQRAKTGLDSALTLLSSQTTWLAAQDRELEILDQTLGALLALIKALGGGYKVTQVEECP